MALRLATLHAVSRIRSKGKTECFDIISAYSARMIERDTCVSAKKSMDIAYLASYA